MAILLGRGLIESTAQGEILARGRIYRTVHIPILPFVGALM